jgi:hypothetical protein
MAGGIAPIANLRGKVNADNELVVAATVQSGPAVITDGVDAGIEATVKDYSNSNPLAVVVMDTNGDPAALAGGTQYAQGSASTDTDTATMAGVVRKDTPAIATGVADGDRTLLSVDSAGLAYTRLRQQLDGDSGAGTQATDVVLLGLPGSGGPVAGGTSTNPLQVSLANTAANSTAVKVDGSAVTQPVSAASLPLPTGASTAAKQPALGTAGTASADVISVQGIASMTPLLATVAGGVAHDSADSGNPVKLGAKAYSPDGTTPGTAVAEGDRSDAKCDLDGRLFVNGYHPRTLTAHLDGSSAYTDQALISDPGDGFQVVITNIIASTGAATALNFFLEEGSTKIFGPIYLEAVAGRGFASGPMYLPCTASTAITLTSSAAIAQSFQVQYHIQAV